MALVLCIGTDVGLMQTRKLILERAGHQVISARDLKTVKQVCRQAELDVVILSQTVNAPEKCRIAELVRQRYRDTQILELHRPGSASKDVPDADDWLEVPAEIPEDLAKHVAALAGSKRRRDPSHLHHRKTVSVGTGRS